MRLEEAKAAQRQELKRLENQRDLHAIAAKLNAYSEADSGGAYDECRTACSEAVFEGSFYRKDDQAYNQAWEALNAH